MKRAFAKDSASRIRNQLGLTQTEMGVRFGVTEQSIRGWETGRNQITGAACRAYELEEWLIEKKLKGPTP